MKGPRLLIWLSTACLIGFWTTVKCGAAPQSHHPIIHPFIPSSLYPSSSLHLSIPPDDITYWKDIRPIFQKNCTICHSPKNISKKEIGGGLALTNFNAVVSDPKDAVIRPGDSAQSKLYQLIVTNDEEKRMPKDAEPLGERDIELIRKWIDGGAKEGDRPEQLPAETAAPAAPKRPTSLVRTIDVVLPTAMTVSAELVKALGSPAAQAGKLDLTLKIGPLPPVTALAYGPDGKWLAIGSYGSIAIWDLDKGELLKSIDAPGAVHSIAVSADSAGPGRLAAAGGLPARSGAVLIVDTQNWELLTTLGEHTDVVYDVAFSPDGQKLATASLDKTIRVWTASDWKSIQALKGHSDFVYSVSFTPDGKHLISSSKDRSIKVHNVETWESERTLTGHNEEVLTTAVSGDSYNVVSAGKEPQLRWWIIENGQNNRTMTGHSGTVNQIVFSKDGKRIASVGQDKQVRIWDGSEGKLVRSIAGSTEWLYAVAFSPDAKFVAAGSWDGVVRVWETETGRLLASLIAPPSPDAGKPQWIVATPEGFYQASDDMAALAQWRTGGQPLSGAILMSTLRKAEPVQRALHGESVENPKFDAVK
jgi:WD40 repeat protein